MSFDFLLWWLANANGSIFFLRPLLASLWWRAVASNGDSFRLWQLMILIPDRRLEEASVFYFLSACCATFTNGTQKRGGGQYRSLLSMINAFYMYTSINTIRVYSALWRIHTFRMNGWINVIWQKYKANIRLFADDVAKCFNILWITEIIFPLMK